MTVAIPVWNHMVSPVLDAAQMLRVYEISQDASDIYKEHRLPESIAAKASAIADLADVLICGALSGELARALESLGVRVHPWIMGEVAAVVGGYRRGDITSFEYTMPGCRRMQGHCGRHSCRGHHGARHRNGA